MDLQKLIANQKPSWIIVEGLIVLGFIVSIVIYAFVNLNDLQETEEIYQTYGDNAARVEYQ